MKKIAMALLMLSVIPCARALDTYDPNQILSYVAMPLAVDSVCNVNGVQTDQVGQLVSYMNQANVDPNDFADVFRYVPVALVMRADNRPDFVQWVGGEVNQGVVGGALVTAMESQLRTYDQALPASYVTTQTYDRTYRRRRRPIYLDAYASDYVPVAVRTYCDHELIEPMSLIEMPVAVADVVDLGVPLGRLGNLVVQLNLGDVPPLQFVELMRYAPAALVVNGPYYGQPDFVQYVQTQVGDGVTGYPLVQNVYQQLPAYGVSPQIDMVPPAYAASQTYYVPPVVQNWVDPVSPAFVPDPVRTRIATVAPAARFANQPVPVQAPTAVVAAPSQVQRLLNAPGSGAVVTNRAEARRELAAQSRGAREAPVAAVPPVVAAPSRIAVAPTAVSPREPRRGRAIAAPAQAPMISSAPARPQFHGAPARVASRAPQPARAAQPRMVRAARPAPVQRQPQRALPPPMISSAPARPQFHPAPAARRAPEMMRPAPQAARPAPQAVRPAPPPAAAAAPAAAAVKGGEKKGKGH